MLRFVEGVWVVQRGSLQKKAYVFCGEEYVLGARGAPRGPRYRSSAAPLYLPSVGRGSRSLMVHQKC